MQGSNSIIPRTARSTHFPRSVKAATSAVEQRPARGTSRQTRHQPRLIRTLTSSSSSEDELVVRPLPDEIRDVARVESPEAEHQIIEPDYQGIEQVNQPIMAEDANAEVQQANAQAPPNLVQPNNLLAFNFRPQSFDGTRLDSANKWLRNFNRYGNLAGVNGGDRCTLLGLLLSGTAETWYNSLPQEVREDYDELERRFRAKYVDAENTRMQRQMSTLTRMQQTGESVDSYFTDARSKLEEHHFPQNFEITLLINGLRSDIKGLVMQHQPFNNVDDLFNKAKHIEASLRSSPINPYLTPAAPMLAAVTKEDLMVTCGDLERMQRNLVDQIVKEVKGMTFDKSPQPQYVVPKVETPKSVTFTPEANACYSCGRTSHFARNCPFERRNSIARRPPTPFPRERPYQNSSFGNRPAAAQRRPGNEYRNRGQPNRSDGPNVNRPVRRNRFPSSGN